MIRRSSTLSIVRRAHLEEFTLRSQLREQFSELFKRCVREGLSAFYLLFVACRPSSANKQDLNCNMIRTNVRWFVYLLSVQLILNLAILVIFNTCNLFGRRPLLVAESLSRWLNVAQLVEALLLLIGYPSWFYTTIWDHGEINQSCKLAWDWDWLNFVNFLFLTFYASVPTLISTLLLFYLVYNLPSIFSLFWRRRQQRAEQQDILSGLTKYVYDADKFKTYNECSICFTEFIADS